MCAQETLTRSAWPPPKNLPFHFRYAAKLSSLFTSYKLRCQVGDPPALKPCRSQRSFIRFERAVIARKRRAIRMAGLELDWVGVTGANNDRPPVIKVRLGGGMEAFPSAS